LRFQFVADPKIADYRTAKTNRINRAAGQIGRGAPRSRTLARTKRTLFSLRAFRMKLSLPSPEISGLRVISPDFNRTL